MTKNRAKAFYHCFAGGSAVLLLMPALAWGADGGAAQKIPQWPSYWHNVAAVFLIFTSFVTTAALNAAKPNTRFIGTLLASFGCFGIFAFYIWALIQGVVSNPRPIYTPTDQLKPRLITLLAGLAAIAGIFLLQVARWQKKRTDMLSLPSENSPEKYGKVSRYLHWTVAILFLVMIPMGIFISMIPPGTPYRFGFYGLHKTIGVTILLLVLVRIFWNFRSKRPSLDKSLSSWERRLAHGAHILLYIFMLGFPITGYIMSTFAGNPTSFFLWKLPMLLPENGDAATFFGLMHKIILPYLFYIVFGAHILGSLKHRFIDKRKEFFRRMVS